MPASGMLRSLGLVRTDILEEHIDSIVRVTGIGDLGKTLTVTSNRGRSVLRVLVTVNFLHSSPIFVTLLMEAIHSSENSVLVRSTQRSIPENCIFDAIVATTHLYVRT
jgi:hypothetical protein